MRQIAVAGRPGVGRGLALLGISLVLCLWQTNEARAESASEVIARTDGIVSPQRFAAESQLDVEREDGGRRVYRLQLYRRGDNTLVTFLEPAVEKGRRILRVGEDMWMLLPNVKRPTRVSAKQNFMGGDFNNNDVLRLSLTDDYTAQFGTGGDAGHFQLILTAKDGSITYAKVVALIDKTTYLPTQYDYYTESGKLVKRMVFSDIGDRGDGVRSPRKWTMTNMVTGRSSYMTFVRVKANEGPGPEAFQLNNLGK